MSDVRSARNARNHHPTDPVAGRYHPALRGCVVFRSAVLARCCKQREIDAQETRTDREKFDSPLAGPLTVTCLVVGRRFRFFEKNHVRDTRSRMLCKQSGAAVFGAVFYFIFFSVDSDSRGDPIPSRRRVGSEL